MSLLICGCGPNSKAKKRSKSFIGNTDLALYKQKYRFADNELLEFRQRFLSLANTQGLIDKPSFLESMGVLGMNNGSFLSDRIFQVVDKDKDGYIRLDEYLSYFDILIHGSQEEKYELTFRMIEIEGKGWFSYQEFYEMIIMILHTWNNITGHNYNINQNNKLEHFLNVVFQKFDVNKDGLVTLECFKIAVSKEPELLEIFDYFNEGIIDTVQPPSELECQNQELLQELEELHSKVNHLKALLKGKGNIVWLEEKNPSVHKERSPHPSTSIIPRGSVFQVHKNDEYKLTSPGVGSSYLEPKASMLQSLDTKIKRTAIFEHLKQGSVDDIPFTTMVRPHSAIIRDGRNSINRGVQNAETINQKIHLMSASKPGNNERLETNSLDGSLLETSPQQEPKKRKPSIFANNRMSPQSELEEKARRRSSSMQMPYSFGQRSSVKQEKNGHNLHLNIRHNETDVLKEGEKKHSEPLPEIPDKQQSEAEGSMKDDLQIIREEKTVDYQHKLSGFPLTPEKNPLKTFKLSGETFLGLLLDNSTHEAKNEEQNQEDYVLENNLKESLEKSRRNSGRNQGMAGFMHRRGNTVMLPPKVLETENFEIMNTSKVLTEPFSSNNKLAFKLEDIKLSDSLVVPNSAENRVSKRDIHSDDSNVSSHHVKENNSHIDMTGNWGIHDNPEKNRVQLITNQIDLIANETVRIMDTLHKRRQVNKSEKKGEEEKKMEMMKELTAQNIHKTTKAKDKKGNFVSFGHQNWNLVLNMMLGIQMAVKSAVQRPESLSSKDFNIKYIFELIPKRTSEIKDTYKICTFFDYAPSIFLEIRRLFGIKNEDYLKSIGPESMLNGLIKGNLSTLAELTSSGKSGSFFYYSADGKYTLKTISREEFHFLRKILKNYYNYVMDNSNTLITKFFGLHKVRFMKGPQRNAKLYFIIMTNVFQTAREIHIRYDLKGSTQGRITKDEDPSIAKKRLEYPSK